MSFFKKLSFLAFLLLPLFSNAQMWRWGVGSGGDCDAVAIAVDRSGNTYGAGQLFDGSTVAYFGTDTLVSTSQIAIVSLDPYGNYRWEKGASSTVFGEIWNLAIDTTGNLYVFGYYYSSLTMDGHTITSPSLAFAADFCAKITSSGTVVWLRNIIDSVQGGCVGSVDYSGNIYVAGSFYASHLTIGSSTFTNHGLSDCFIAKFDTTGTPLWAHTFGGTRQDGIGSISVTGEGRVWIGGAYSSPVLYIGPDTFSGPGPDTGGIFVVSYDIHGNQAWAKGMRVSSGGCRPGSLCVDQWDNVYLNGSFEAFGGKMIIDTADSVSNANPNPFLLKFDTTGHVIWAHGNFSSTCRGSTSMAIDSFANLWLSGSYKSVYGSDSMYLLHLDTAGNIHDSLFLAAGGDDGAPIAVDNKGSLYLVDDYGIDEFAIGTDTLRLIDVSMESLYIAKYCYFACVTEAVSKDPPKEADILLYPNPAANELTLRSDVAITKVSISDLVGQPMISRCYPDGTTEIQVNIERLPTGMYIVNVDGHAPKKFVKL